MAKSCSVSVIVVNWNTRCEVVRCVESILQSTDRDIEIIVVDNASTDGSVEALNENFGAEKCVSVLRQDRNLGYAKGNNIGFATSRGEYVFILNPDTIVRRRAIDLLADYLDEHADVGAVGPWIDGVEPDQGMRAEPTRHVKVDEWWINRFGRVRIPWLLGRFLRPVMQADAEVEVDWVLNAASMIRRSALPNRELLFDEMFFIGTEEIELSLLHLRPRGYRSVILANAQVAHLVGRSFTHRFDLRSLLTRYSQTAIFYRRVQVHGPFWARIDALVGALDYALLGLVLLLRWPARPRAEVIRQVRIYGGLSLVLFQLLVRGKEVAIRYDQVVRATLSEPR